MPIRPPDIVLVLPNVRSAYNVGAILRTADAAGATHVYLVGGTPAPRDRFDRPNSSIAKTALGAERSVPWSVHARLAPLLGSLRRDGRQIIMMECGTTRGKEFDRIAYASRIAIVVGSEVRGLSHRTLLLADTIAEIPQYGTKESLNVSVALGIVLYAAARFRITGGSGSPSSRPGDRARRTA